MKLLVDVVGDQSWWRHVSLNYWWIVTRREDKQIQEGKAYRNNLTYGDKI